MVLPQYYNHANFKSFVRQLHMYSFRKLQVDSESDWCARARDRRETRARHDDAPPLGTCVSDRR